MNLNTFVHFLKLAVTEHFPRHCEAGAREQAFCFFIPQKSVQKNAEMSLNYIIVINEHLPPNTSSPQVWAPLELAEIAVSLFPEIRMLIKCFYSWS